MNETEVIDEQSISYQNFVECFLEGASLQDIYTNSDHGYATNQRTKTLDATRIEKRKQSAKNEFSRIFRHMQNLVDPIDKQFGFQGKEVLDFGCGTGALSIAMALRGAKVTGVDPTQLSLDACQHRAQYFQVDDSAFRSKLVETSPGLPFDDKSFEIVISNSVMEFIPAHRKEYIVDLLRILKPAGLLILATENGLFPRDYYTGQMFPRFRRKRAIDKNLPYGLTYFELLSWIKSSPRVVQNLSGKNFFNSFDNLSKRRRDAGRIGSARMISGFNRIFKRACQLASIPSDIFLPYATYIFRVDQ